MRHLAIVTPLPPTLSGIADYGYFIANALAKSGEIDKISVLTNSNCRKNLFGFQSRIIVEPVWHRNSAFSGWKIVKRLQALKPDIVWYNLGASSFGTDPFSNLSGHISMALGFAYGIPTVATLHEVVEIADTKALQVQGNIVIPFGKKLFHHLTAYTDVTCVTLRHYADWLIKHNKRNNVRHIPHGAYDTQFLTELASRNLLAFGCWAPYKGLEHLLSTFRRLQKSDSTLQLTIAGGEHPRFPGYLSRIQQQYAADQQIRWLGYIPENQLSDVFQKATVIILPYSATTGASSVFYRAASYGRPIIASDIPGLRATVEEEGFCAEFYSPNDEKALSKSIQRLVSNPQLRSQIARRNFRIVKNRLTLDDTCNEYLRAFELAIALRSSRARIFSMSSQS